MQTIWSSDAKAVGLFKKIAVFLEMIKFEHSIFALPFAYLGFVLAINPEKVTVTKIGDSHLFAFLWVTLAMVSLRTAAMTLNRLIDHKIDQENPRTKSRALPAKLLTRRFTWIVAVSGLCVFIYSAYQLNPLCFYLSPIPIALGWIYPYLKRWTWFSHFVLGLTLGLAPYGGWLAVRPELNLLPALLTIGVTSWVFGFDVFYALQDAEFDRKKGLHSLPVRVGADRAIFIAKICQGFTIAAFVLLGLLASLGIFYWIGIVFAAGFIYHEHRLVSRFGLSKINQAFFNMNAWVSVVLFAAVFADFLWSHRG